MKPTLYMLIGVPAAGKSTWATEHATPGTVYISSDYFVDKFARRLGKTYNQVFNDVVSRSVQLMNRRASRAKQQGKNIIWDQTNTTVRTRARKLRMLAEYSAVAVVFATPPKDVLDSRLAARIGKSIPAHIMHRMINEFTYPQESEGFAEIIQVNAG